MFAPAEGAQRSYRGVRLAPCPAPSSTSKRVPPPLLRCLARTARCAPTEEAASASTDIMHSRQPRRRTAARRAGSSGDTVPSERDHAKHLQPRHPEVEAAPLALVVSVCLKLEADLHCAPQARCG